MKRWISKLAKLTVMMALLGLFSVVSFAGQWIDVTAVKLENAVEVTWDYLEDYKGMEVWCAVYDADGKMVAIAQADMSTEGQACRVYCDTQKADRVKLFLLGEALEPAEDVEIAGQSGEPGDHICMWVHYEEELAPTFLEPGMARACCTVCGQESDAIEIPPLATPEERELVDRALDFGLLEYFCGDISEIENLNDATRLDVAKLAAALIQAKVEETDNCNFKDCADLTELEKGVINAVAKAGVLNGGGDGSFNPNAKITLSELTVVIMNCLGGPQTNWDVTCSNVPAWAAFYANNLYNLGILGDDPNFNGTVAATKADLLKWMVNACKWEGQTIDEIRPVNLRFGEGGKWLYWDVEQSEITNLRYMVSLHDAETGEWIPNMGIRLEEGEQPGMCTRWTNEGWYPAVRVVPRIGNRNMWDASVEDWDMSVTVFRDEWHIADVSLMKNEDGSMYLSISGLPADEKVRVEIGDEEKIYNDGISQRVGEDGTLICEFKMDWDGPIYYAIESFSEYYENDGNLEYLVTCYGDGVIKPTPVIPDSTVTQQELVEKANNAGLLKYIDLTDMDGVSRLEAAKLLMAMGNFWMSDGDRLEFTDIADLTDLEKDIIATVVAHGFMAGTGPDTFAPDGTVSNAQFLLMLYRVMGEPNGVISGANWNLNVSVEMSKLGILQDGDPSVSAAATKESALTWMLRVKDWMKDNPGGGGSAKPPVDNDAFGITDVWFDMFMGEVPVMYYELPADIANDDVKVELSVPTPNGGWDRVMGSNQGRFWVDWLEPGVYDRFKLDTVVNGETKGSVIVDELTVTINPGGVSDAQVTFTKIENGYRWVAENGQPDTCFSLEVREEGNGSFRPTGCFDSDGVGDGREGGSQAISHIENGTFVLREYRDLSIDKKNLTVSVWATEEKPCISEDQEDQESDPDYEVSNVRFKLNKRGIPCIRFDLPAVASGDVEYVVAMREDGGEWEQNWIGDNDTLYVTGVEAGVCYDEIAVVTVVDGEVAAWVLTDMKLEVFSYGTSDAEATFEKTKNAYGMDAYQISVSDGMPDTTAFVWIVEEDQGDVTLAGTLDAAGRMTLEEGGDRAMSHIENGYYIIREVDELTISPSSDEGDSLVMVVRDTAWKKCLDEGGDSEDDEQPCAASNIRFVERYGKYYLQWDVPETTENLRYRVYALNDETGNWEQLSSTSQDLMFVGFTLNGSYSGIKVATELNREIISETVADDLKLQITVETGLDADTSIVYDAENDMYNWTVTGLSDDAKYAFIVMIKDAAANGSSSFGGSVNAPGTASGGGNNSSMKQILESGFYMVKECAAYEMSADGKSLSYIVREGKEWRAFFTSYGYVTGIKTELGEKGDWLDYVTFEYEGVSDTIQAKHQYTGLLAVGDYFAYRLHLRTDGVRRMSDIVLVAQ